MKSSIVAAIFATGVAAQGGPWAQCGGQGYSGPTTCVSGYKCVYQNDWYSQCLPGDAAGTSTTSVKSTSTTSSAPSSTSTAGGQSGPYAQCGGNGWTGPKSCVAGYKCVATNEWYSQCLPGVESSTTVAPPTSTSTTATVSSTSTSEEACEPETTTFVTSTTKTTAPVSSTTEEACDAETTAVGPTL